MWQKTAFFLVWDENDGFFDHVRPPTPPAGTRGEFIRGLPIGLGFRVPMIVISPWSTGGFVCSDTFDHTSIIRFMERRFGVREPNISAWRRRTCGDLTAAFDFGQRSGATALHECGTLPAATVPKRQSLPRQEPGTRPRRPSTH